MAMPKKKMGILRCMWRDPAMRIFITLICVVIGMIVGLRFYNAAYVYNDWRCLTADCKILKAGDRDALLLGGSL